VLVVTVARIKLLACCTQYEYSSRITHTPHKPHMEVRSQAHLRMSG